jgi:hypothetical protein
VTEPTESTDRAAAAAEDVLRPSRLQVTLAYSLFALVAFAVAAGFRFHQGGAPDNDSFYHIRHAAIYAERGLMTREFPWLVYSIISRLASDIGYGFHLLLIPFAKLRDPIRGLQWASVFEAAAVLLMLYAVMRRHRLAYPWAWPFLLFFLGPPILYTFLLTRPQTLTMGFSALLLSCLITGSPWGALLAAFAISFTHLNISLIIPVIVGAAFVVRIITERTWDWRRAGMALGGLLLGWLARPNPLGVVKIEYVQMIVHTAVRQRGIPLLFGREWLPVPPPDAFSLFSYFLVIWLGLALLFLAATALRKGEESGEGRYLLWCSLLLSLGFFAVTVLNTRRATPLWATFAVIFTAAAFTSFVDPKRQAKRLLNHEARLIAALCVALVFGLMIKDCVDQHLLQGRWGGGEPYRFKPAAEWIAHDSQPGDIVYNVDWSMFPELFCWNTRNYYVSGLDPIFLYAYDSGLYWKAHHLQTADTTEYTCAAQDCAKSRHEDTLTVLTRDFRARYVVLDTQQSVGLYYYLKDRPGVQRGYEGNGLAVFRLKPPA